ncbi:MAG: cytidine deaminase [bacterium]
MSKKIDSKYLLQLACEASFNAYSPYSKFKVGACILFEDGSIYKGCNIENSSYGLTLCAEQNAISTAIAEGKQTGLAAVAIYSPSSKLCYPCGACRQWIVEFSKQALIIVENSDGNPLNLKISELLPLAFITQV